MSQPDQPPQEPINAPITNWFNTLPIRIVGDNTTPYFYAQDIGLILGMKAIRNSLKGFTEFEIVSKEIRARENIITYRQYNNEWRRDDSIILLTEPGVYRLVMKSKLPVAQQLRIHIYDALRNARIAENQKLKLMEADNKSLKEQAEKLDLYMKESEERRDYDPVWYLFRTTINDDPYKHIDSADKNSDGLRDHPAEYLYVCTCEPLPQDFNDRILVAKIYGFKDEIPDQLANLILDTNPNTMKTRIYMTQEPSDDLLESCVRIKWQ